MATITPRFNDDERSLLQQQHGLTTQQVCVLERHLGVILDRLGPHVPMGDVRDALRDFGREVDAVCKRMRLWSQVPSESPGAEALGHLNIAGSEIDLSASRPDDGTWPEYVVASELVMLLGQISHRALENAPSVRRVPHRASPRAIATIVERLNRPRDGASRRAAVALAPRYSDTELPVNSGPSFLGVATIVFRAVYRALPTTEDRSDAVAARPANSIEGAAGGDEHHDAKDPAEVRAATSIEAYLKQLPVSARRKPGRPKKA